MTPASQINNGTNGGILGSFILILGLAATKAINIDYKTLLKICITVIGIMGGWAITHWVSFTERVADTQTTIINSQAAIIKDIGDIKTANAESKALINSEFVALKKCLDEHIIEYQNSKKK